MKLVPKWITSPRSALRGWLVGIGLGSLALAISLSFPAFFATHEWIPLILIGIAYFVGCVAYEHPNPATGMRNIARLPHSPSRGWFVGVVIFALEGRAGGNALNAVLKEHKWLSLGPALIAWWVGYRSHVNPNPLPGMLRDVRELLPPRVIVWAVVGGLAFFFADPIKGALDSILPTDVPGLAAMLFGILLVLTWETESEARKTREKLKAISAGLSAVTSLQSEVDSLQSETREFAGLLQEIAAGLQRLEEQTERMEERAAARRADQQRELSELLQLTEAVLAHQPPLADER